MNLVIGVTGATGTVYAVRLLEYLKDIEEIKTHLIMSKWAINNLEVETDYSLDYVYSLADFIHNNDNLGACVASGSFITDGMIILPCSMKTLSSISNGFSSTLIDRAADVMIKEGRKLVISPRETPLSSIHLENMYKLSRIGATIIPAMPGFYNNPQTIDDLVNFMVGKILNYLNIDNNLFNKWEDTEYET